MDMETPIDSIETLLEKTGLSCDDLLQKLLAYKSLKEPNNSDTGSINSELGKKKEYHAGLSQYEENSCNSVASCVKEENDISKKSEVQNLLSGVDLKSTYLPNELPSKSECLEKVQQLNETKDDTIPLKNGIKEVGTDSSEEVLPKTNHKLDETVFMPQLNNESQSSESEINDKDTRNEEFFVTTKEENQNNSLDNVDFTKTDNGILGVAIQMTTADKQDLQKYDDKISAQDKGYIFGEIENNENNSQDLKTDLMEKNGTEEVRGTSISTFLEEINNIDQIQCNGIIQRENVLCEDEVNLKNIFENFITVDEFKEEINSNQTTNEQSEDLKMIKHEDLVQTKTPRQESLLKSIENTEHDDESQDDQITITNIREEDNEKTRKDGDIEHSIKAEENESIIEVEKQKDLLNGHHEGKEKNHIIDIVELTDSSERKTTDLLLKSSKLDSLEEKTSLNSVEENEDQVTTSLLSPSENEINSTEDIIDSVGLRENENTSDKLIELPLIQEEINNSKTNSGVLEAEQEEIKLKCPESSTDHIQATKSENEITTTKESNENISEADLLMFQELYEFRETTEEKNSALISSKRKSISDELIRKLNSGSNETNQDDMIVEFNKNELCKFRIKPRTDLFKEKESIPNPNVLSQDITKLRESIVEPTTVMTPLNNSITPESNSDNIPVWTIRKIDEGFLRQKNTAKMLENDLTTKTVEDNSIDLEKIRENLKLQLTSLRNRKKENNSVQNRKISAINKLKLKYKKKLPESKTKFFESSKTEPPEVPKPSNSEEQLFSMSEETNFLIVDVKGGIDLIEAVETGKENENEKNVYDKIKLTKTNDITKIKGWKRKQFEVESNSHQILNDITYEDVDDDEIIKKNVKNSDKELSPFVSNTLEEFLTENSTLNISYQIPKLGAEDALKKRNYKEVIPIPKIIETSSTQTNKQEKPKGFKPKTLAEKRRLLEENVKQTKKRSVPTDLRTSYVYYNDQKLTLLSTSSNKCFARITHNPSKPVKNEKVTSTSSLLSIWHRNRCKSVEFKPGPLSMKPSLQTDKTKYFWQISVHKLPQVVLDVVPEFGKSIPPYLLNYLPIFEPVINKNRLEFALNALEPAFCKDVVKKCYRFPIPYVNGQEYILMKKEIKNSENVLYSIDPKRNSVESVIQDLLTYVENKEIEDTIIKDSEPYIEENSALPIIANEQIKRPNYKRLEHELSRLNCKIVSLSLDEGEDEENTNCNKTFCKLGCICKSLNPKSRLPVHCSKVDCMFECKCTKGRFCGKVSYLSSDTVTRIEDQVKKDLAKVEREFTQTLIRADDQAILVPSTQTTSGRSKRTKRTPKRYSHYKFFEKSNVPEEMSECFVKLQNLDLKTVIPFCMDHNKYGCYCLEHNEKLKRKYISEHETLKRRKSSSRLTEYSHSDENDCFEGNSDTEDVQKITRKEKCSRTSMVHKEYITRNKSSVYVKHLEKKTRVFNSNYKITNVTQCSEEQATDDIDVETSLSLPGNEYLENLSNAARLINRKRKQVLKIRKDDEPAIKMKFKKIKPATSIESCYKIDDKPYPSVFDGEIVISTTENKEFVRKLGITTSEPFMRLLPWLNLLDNYYNNKVKIWCSTTHEKLVISKSDKIPPEGYVEINKSGKRNGIITWILTKKLPQQTIPDLVHIILTPLNEHYEISGLCLKNPIYKKHNEEQENISKDGKTLIHKNHKNELNTLELSTGSYPSTLLYIWRNDGDDKIETHPLTMKVKLPIISKNFRWRMLYLNSNFSFLSFANNIYSIKYTDLMHIVNQAQKRNITVCAKSENLQGSFEKDYGIYAVPGYKDCLFIGPYTLNEDHRLETLRYLRRALVSTSYFEMVQGIANPNYKKAVWLTTTPNRHTNESLLKSPVTKSYPYAEITPLPKKTPVNNEVSSNQTILDDIQTTISPLMVSYENFITTTDLEDKPYIKFPQFTLINGKKMQPHEFNRFITTNIPHFGYLGARQNARTKVIDVNWPFANKILRFDNVGIATEFLKRRFTNLLLPVPASFKIILIILTEIESSNLLPIDPKILSGTFLCGEFGVMDSRNLTPEASEKLGTTQESVVKRLGRRAQYLGALEINKLKEQEKIFLRKKKELLISKQKNVKIIIDLLKFLPTKQRLEEYDKIREQFMKPKKNYDLSLTEPVANLGDNIECIEIEDSESEGESSSVKKTLAPKEKIRSKSSPKTSQNNALSIQNEPDLSPPKKSSKKFQGYEFVKSSTGNVVLSKNYSAEIIPTPKINGLKMTIKNNRIILNDENASKSKNIRASHNNE